ncbi:transcriptional repressor [Coriobacteriales bacterium OH1046]|nr:transcriptional repressor [Coriobacteriales bacterium OH1046]
MAGRGRYRTRQRELVASCLAQHPNSYLTVDELLSAISEQGNRIGRTTVYRALESMVGEGAALKAAVPGSEASYRIATEGAAGQLVCLSCGQVLPLDCRMANGLAGHILEHHGFRIDPTRTVLYGLCTACLEADHAR